MWSNYTYISHCALIQLLCTCIQILYFILTAKSSVQQSQLSLPLIRVVLYSSADHHDQDHLPANLMEPELQFVQILLSPCISSEHPTKTIPFLKTTAPTLPHAPPPTAAHPNRIYTTTSLSTGDAYVRIHELNFH